MEQSNDNKYNNSYNLIAYMFDKPSKPKQSRFKTINKVRELHAEVKTKPIYTVSIRVAIVIIGLLAFTKFLNGINHSQPTQSSPTVAIEQPIAKIDSLAAQPQPQVINTVNLDNSLAKAKEVFDTFPEVEGESPVENMKRMNKHIMDYSNKNK